MILDPNAFMKYFDVYVACSTPDALDNLLGVLRPLAEAVASSFSDDSHYRLDLIQDCLEYAIKALDVYDPMRSNPYAFFAMVFKQRCMYKLKKYQEPIAATIDDLPLADDTELIVHDDHVLAELIARNKQRFSCVTGIDEVTRYVYKCIINGSRPGNGKGIISDNTTSADRHTLMTVYYSSLVWLRYKYIFNTYYSFKEPDSLSLLYDLYDIFGEEVYEVMSIVFAGMRLHFPN